MTNPIINPQPNYSGVTIQISNPAVYAGGNGGACIPQCNANRADYYRQGEQGYVTPQGYIVPKGYYNQYPASNNPELIPQNTTGQPDQYYYPGSHYYSNGVTNPIADNVAEYKSAEQGAVQGQQDDIRAQSYPVEYYLNKYNKVSDSEYNNDAENRQNKINSFENIGTDEVSAGTVDDIETGRDVNDIQSSNGVAGNEFVRGLSSKTVDDYRIDPDEPQDFTKSQAVIDDLDARAAAEEEAKKNSKQKRVVALTDEYIKSLENYLNNPNDEIRLMASKEILTRLDEDKDRYNDAALNALLNKMLQDPSKLVRVAALSAFAAELASGNDYTVTLLHNIQQNPNSDKEDVLQAADILLKMSAGTEIKNIPNPEVKEPQQQQQ